MPSNRLVNTLRVFWAAIILWSELLVFPYSVSQCRWPDPNPLQSVNTNTRSQPTHVLLIADPQVLDHRSYPDRPPWLVWLSQAIVDFNMRKSWWATRWLRPDVVIFLGDMMDGGRFAMSDTEYESYYARFKNIFSMSEEVPTYYIPGNHDVGIGASEEWSDHARDRYVAHFGPFHQRLNVANHTIVMLDAPGLVNEDYDRYVAGMSYARWAETHPEGPIAFAHESAEASRRDEQPVVLLTHIPLARSRSASCGPLREQGTIAAGVGYGYSNTLSDGLSDMLLQSLRPAIVFSGDDHDYCEHHHTLSASDDSPLSDHRLVKEISVKSFSIAMGVRRPGSQLLSLVAPSPASPSQATLTDIPCFLPFQLGTYVLLYGPLAAGSLLILLVYHICRMNVPASSPSLSSDSRLRPLPSVAKLRASALGLELSASSHTLRDYDTLDEAGEAAFVLPPPTPAAAVTGKDKRQHTWLITLGGRKFILNFSSAWDLTFGCCCSRNRADSMRRTRLLRAFFGDVVAVAWLPITIFACMMWWFL